MTAWKWLQRFDLGNLGDWLLTNGASQDYVIVTSTDPDELLSVAWDRAWLEAFGEKFEDQIGSVHEGGFTWWIETEDGYTSLDSEPGTTVGTFAAFMGDAPTRIVLAWATGGGGLEILLVGLLFLWDLGLTLRELVALRNEGQNALDRRIYAREHDLFEDWRDLDALPMELIQAVKAENPWEMEKFCRVFGATPSEASRLLRHVGYVAERDEGGERIWHDYGE